VLAARFVGRVRAGAREVINYVTGTLGAGKSMYAARIAARALLSGRVVATNMRFVDGWEHLLMNRAFFYKLAIRGRERKQAFWREEVASRYAYVPEIWTLLGARLYGKGEGRGIMILDEAHNEINNREWQAENQKESLRKLTLARKRGWHVYVISQHKDNTDAGVRRIATTEIKLINWRQVVKVPVIGQPLLPFHMFLAQTFMVNQNAQVVSASKKVASEVFFRGWYAGLYDTFEDFDAGLGDDPDALWLPAKRPGVGVRAEERGVLPGTHGEEGEAV